MNSLTEFRELRERAGLSIEEVARRFGYAPRTVYRWERGDSEARRVVLDALRGQMLPAGSAAPKAFTFIDLFAGIGGMRMGFERAGGRCVFTSEWNKYSRLTYEANFRCDHPIAGDITAIPESQIPPHDLLLAGFPCQPFSIAGVSKKNALGRPHGFHCTTQGTLFFDVARMLAHCRPPAFVLENVKNLEHHDRGRTLSVIRDALHELGYSVQFRRFDARSFVPQHRERIFIVGFRERTASDFSAVRLPDPDSGPRLAAVLHPENGSEAPEEPYTQTPDGKVNPKYTLTAHLWKYLQEYAAKHRAKGNGFGYGLFGPADVARTLSARYYKDGSEILIRTNSRPRRLTPRECARLMGFDSIQRKFAIPVSDTQAYKQFGNSVAVPVVAAIAAAIVPHLISASSGQLELPLFSTAPSREVDNVLF